MAGRGRRRRGRYAAGGWWRQPTPAAAPGGRPAVVRAAGRRGRGPASGQAWPGQVPGEAGAAVAHPLAGGGGVAGRSHGVATDPVVAVAHELRVHTLLLFTEHRAVWLERSGTLTIVRASHPRHRDGEALVRVVYTGIYGADVELFTGTHPNPTTWLGWRSRKRNGPDHVRSAVDIPQRGQLVQGRLRLSVGGDQQHAAIQWPAFRAVRCTRGSAPSRRSENSDNGV